MGRLYWHSRIVTLTNAWETIDLIHQYRRSVRRWSAIELDSHIERQGDVGETLAQDGLPLHWIRAIAWCTCKMGWLFRAFARCAPWRTLKRRASRGWKFDRWATTGRQWRHYSRDKLWQIARAAGGGRTQRLVVWSFSQGSTLASMYYSIRIYMVCSINN